MRGRKNSGAWKKFHLPGERCRRKEVLKAASTKRTSSQATAARLPIISAIVFEKPENGEPCWVRTSDLLIKSSRIRGKSKEIRANHGPRDSVFTTFRST